MASGYPDYAAPYGEVLYDKGYINYFGRFSGDVNGGSYADLYDYTIPSGYNIDLSMASMSANGCEAYHYSATYINGVVKKAYYFEVNHLFSSPRYISFKGGENVVVRVYNFGDAKRTFDFFGIGIMYIVGTKPFKPQRDPGKPPKLDKDETLCLTELPWEGLVWHKVKNYPITKETWKRHYPFISVPEGSE